MNQQPDKFFRDKLHGYQKPVSSEAWNRISQNLDNKNRRGLWMKVAAAILFLATTGILLYPGFKRSDTIATIEKTAQTSPDKQATATPPTPITDAAPPEGKKNAYQSKEIQVQSKRPTRKKATQPKQVVTAPHEELELPEVASSDIQPVEQYNEDKQEIAATSTNDNIVEQSSGVTIVFSAEEVNRKYLTKNEDIGATSADKSSSTLKKLLDKAYDLKHNQDPLGGLRQKKDEILAMNFRNEKQRTQND